MERKLYQYRSLLVPTFPSTAINFLGRQTPGSPHFSAIYTSGHIAGALESTFLHLFLFAFSSE